jgi:regulatory protein
VKTTGAPPQESPGEVGPPDDPQAGPPGDPQAVARIICLRLLERRARTRSELATALAGKGVPDDAATAVLDRFTAVGLIDDEALADSYALAQHRERGLAGRAVAQKLRRRGLDDTVVQSALAQIDPGSERAAAERLVAAKLKTMNRLNPEARARRLVGLLARRGYSAGLVHEVVRAAVSEMKFEEPIE